MNVYLIITKDWAALEPIFAYDHFNQIICSGVIVHELLVDITSLKNGETGLFTYKTYS